MDLPCWKASHIEVCLPCHCILNPESSPKISQVSSQHHLPWLPPARCRRLGLGFFWSNYDNSVGKRWGKAQGLGFIPFRGSIVEPSSAKKHGGRLMCSLLIWNLIKLICKKTDYMDLHPQQKLAEKSRRREHILHFLE
jgi:hypothetical protein